MKNAILAVIFAVSMAGAVEASPADAVTQADLQALIERIARLETENAAQAKRIAELEVQRGEFAKLSSENAEQAKRIAQLEDQKAQFNKWMVDQDLKATEQVKKFELQTETLSRIASTRVNKPAEGTTTNETGRIWTTDKGYKYYLADVTAGIFEPLSESGLKITPYGYLVFEAVHNTHGTEADIYADWVKPPSSYDYDTHTTVFSMQDSILGLQFETPEAHSGWTFTGRAEFDLAGDHANDYAFRWRHLYINAEHESGWAILFGQTWHLWKIVTPSEIDGAWMENAGHPYRRSPQIRVTKKIEWDDSSLEIRAGIVKNGPGMGGDRDFDGTQDNSASAWPLVEAALVYDHDASWQDEKDYGGKRWLIGVGGMYGRDKSRNIYATDADGNWILGENDEYDSSMGLIAAQIPFGDFTLTGQFFGGQNLGGVQAGIGQRVGYDAFGNGQAVRTVGGFIDLGYRLNDDWSFAIGYGFDDPMDEDAALAEGRLFNDRAYIDVFYQLTDNLKLAFEYGRLTTDWYLDGHAYSDRFQFSAFFDF